MTDFEKVYKAYFMDVFRYLKKLTRDEHLAEEITSETFFKAMKSLHSFRGDCDIRVWLCQIAKNCYFSYLKKHRKSIPIEYLEAIDFSGQTATVEESIMEHSDALHIHTLLHNLAEPYKEVFMLRVFGELSFKQIGKIFGKTENWACVTYHRARTKIKESMEESS